jgi:hypothetical protein
MADASYNGEVESIKKMLQMQSGRKCFFVDYYIKLIQVIKTETQLKKSLLPFSCQATLMLKSMSVKDMFEKLVLDKDFNNE